MLLTNTTRTRDSFSTPPSGYWCSATEDDDGRRRGESGRIYLTSAARKVILSTIDRIVDRLVVRLHQHAAGSGSAAKRIRAMLVERVLFRFDSVRNYSHGLDELFASLRPAYLARRDRYFAAEAAVFTGVVRAGHSSGQFDAPNPPAAAEAMLLATNSLLPYALSARELGRRIDVEARVGRVADLLLFGLSRGRKPRTK